MVLLVKVCLTTHVASLHTWLTKESPPSGGGTGLFGTTRSVALLSMHLRCWPFWHDPEDRAPIDVPAMLWVKMGSIFTLYVCQAAKMKRIAAVAKSMTESITVVITAAFEAPRVLKTSANAP